MKIITRIAFLVFLAGFVVGFFDHRINSHRKARGLVLMTLSVVMMGICFTLIKTEKRDPVANTLRRLSDRLWVIRAYLRGKVLRQKGYQLEIHGESLSFSAPRGATATRLEMLIRCWGGRYTRTADILEILSSASRDEEISILHAQGDPHPFLSFKRRNGEVVCNPNQTLVPEGTRVVARR